MKYLNFKNCKQKIKVEDMKEDFKKLNIDILKLHLKKILNV